MECGNPEEVVFEEEAIEVKYATPVRHECEICHATFTWKCSLTRHYRKHTGEKPYSCKYCDECFRLSDELRKHERVKHPTILLRFECDDCHEDFPSRSLLRLHKKQHAGAYECEICAKVYAEKKRLTEHKQRHFVEKHFKFVIIPDAEGSSSASRRRLAEKRKDCQGDSDKETFACRFCDETFNGKKNLYKHERLHVEEAVGHGSQSTPANSKKPNLLKKKHIDESNIECKCETCRKLLTISQQSGYSPKKKRQNPLTKSYKCVICEAEFDSAASVVEHEKIHKGMKCYECEVCNRAFCSRSRFLKHIRTHSVEKPFACDLCDEKFCTNYRLIAHKRLHIDEYNSENVTNESSNSAASSDIIYVHENQVQCPICHVRFKYAFLLRSHLPAHSIHKLSWLKKEK